MRNEIEMAILAVSCCGGREGDGRGRGMEKGWSVNEMVWVSRGKALVWVPFLELRYRSKNGYSRCFFLGGGAGGLGEAEKKWGG